MATATLDVQPRADIGQAPQRGELALALQEAFTVAVRLRAGRQVAADASSFRLHVKQLLAAADQRARASGYDGESVKLAVYAFIALLDESVLNSALPMFADWARQPLQEEVFGEHMAGENFFRTLHDLLGRQDSDVLADVLEVYQLCLLLGFRGRYGAGDPSAPQALTASVQQKLQRIRGAPPLDLVPDWQRPSHETVVLGRDPWARRLALFAAGSLTLAVLLYVLFRLLLRSGITELRTLV
ncbi:MAG TPA: DotU family type IV/VI secretion system protein [Longimicrobiales bacterium]|nr:DotU family type IV/VI secretion system protein [Longimicrobiales bacterium]